jgi:hypothetical protein
VIRSPPGSNGLRPGEWHRPTGRHDGATATQSHPGRQHASVPTTLRKIFASLATVTAAAALMAFGTYGTFDSSNTGMARSVRVDAG